MSTLQRLFILLPLLFVFACDETLPPRIEPQNTLAISNVIYSQGIYIDGAHMVFIIEIENRYLETFQEQVDVVGKATIWWQNRPQVRATLAIGNQHFVPPSRFQGNVLTLDPGGRCALKIYWYLTLDDGRNLLDLLDYSDGVAREGLINSKPETFVMEAEIKLFSQIGYLRSQPIVFSFIGYKKAPKDTEPQKISRDSIFPPRHSDGN